MSSFADGRRVETVFVLRLACPREPQGMGAALTTIRRAGGDVRLHVSQAQGAGYDLCCVCAKAAEAAAALAEQGVDARLETAVWVETEDLPGALAHLVQSVEAAGVTVRESFGTSAGDALRVVLQTDDNPRAEDALRAYLDLAT